MDDLNTASTADLLNTMTGGQSFSSVKTEDQPTFALIEQMKTGENPDQYRNRKLQEATAEVSAARENRGAFESGTMFAAEKSLPFASAVLGQKFGEIQQRALENVKTGRASPDDYKAAASFYQEQERAKNESIPRAVLEMAGRAPAIIGEAAVAGPIARGAGLAGETFAGNIAARAATAPAMPSMWLEQAQQRAIQQGGDWKDPQNLVPAMGYGALQNIVLGQVGRYAGKAPGGMVARVGAAGAIGTAEQQVIDVAAGLVDKVLPDAYKINTGYGAIGDFLGGKTGEGFKKLAVQATTFSLFALAHGGNPAKPLEDLKTAADALHEAGVESEKAVKILGRIYDKKLDEVLADHNVESQRLRDQAQQNRQANHPETPDSSPKVEPAQEQRASTPESTPVPTPAEVPPEAQTPPERGVEPPQAVPEVPVKKGLGTRRAGKVNDPRVQDEVMRLRADGKSFVEVAEAVGLKSAAHAKQVEERVMENEGRDPSFRAEGAGRVIREGDVEPGKLRQVGGSPIQEARDKRANKMGDDWLAQHEADVAALKDSGKLTPEQEKKHVEINEEVAKKVRKAKRENISPQEIEATVRRSGENASVPRGVGPAAPVSDANAGGAGAVGAGPVTGSIPAAGKRAGLGRGKLKESVDGADGNRYELFDRSYRVTDATGKVLDEQVFKSAADAKFQFDKTKRLPGVAAGGFAALPGGGHWPPKSPPDQSKTAMATALAGATPSKLAEVGSGIGRHQLAILARKKAIAEDVLRSAALHYDKEMASAKDDTERAAKFLLLTDAIESGKIASLPDAIRPFAEAIRKMVDERTEAVVERNLVKSTIENYLGHLWKKGDATAEEIGRGMYARRPFAGREGFRKQRSLDTFRDGINAGLTPADWNPVRLTLMKLHEIDKSVMAHDWVQELENNGVWKYVRIGGKRPDGWTKIDDKVATVYAPPTTKITEVVDKQQMEGLEKFADSLGIKVSTKVKSSEIVKAGVAGGLAPPTGSTGKTLGVSFGDQVIRRFGTPEEILAHEIGHQLDAKYGLARDLSHAPFADELNALADLRASGRVSPEYQAYLREPGERVANLIAGYLHAPELTKQTAPRSVEYLESMMNSHKELAPLRDIKPSLELDQREQEMRLAGPMLVGHYYTPDTIAGLLNNQLSPGLYGRYRGYDVAREAANALNGIQLGFSAFHAGFVFLDTQASAAALGLQMMSRGDLAKGLGKVFSAPVAPFINAIRSSPTLREYYKPGSQGAETTAIIESLMQAGGRAKMDQFYGGTQIDKFRKAMGEFRGGQYGKGGELLLRAIPALSEALSKPIMEVLVPRMKLGVFADMARYEMEKNPGMSPEQYRATLGKAWDSVENRLGQLTYDNLFWHRTMKDALMLGVRSVGWNVGTVRELGGGVKDIPKSFAGMSTGAGITPRMAYIVAMPMVVAAYAAIYQYIATGKGPDEWRDYVAPRTGRNRKDGSPDRVMLPSYMRDVMSLRNRADEGPFTVAGNAWRMTKHKLNPLFGLLGDMLENEDFHKTAIRDPNNPWTVQARDLGMHIMESFEPMATRTIRERSRQGIPMGEALQGMVGVTPAPGYVTQSSEQQRALEKKYGRSLTPLEKKRLADKKAAK